MTAAEVEYCAFFPEPSGYGIAARAHARALIAAGARVYVRSLRLTNRRPQEWLPVGAGEADLLARCRPPAQRPAIRISHVPPPVFGQLAEPPAPKRIGVAAWEVEQLPPAFVAGLAHVDQVWVPSTFCRDAFDPHLPGRVHVVPHPVTAPPDGPRSVPHIPDDMFLFLSIMQWQDRKNPLGLLRAFRLAFEGRRDVGLLLRVGFRLGARRSETIRRIAEAIGPCLPPVYLVTRELDAATLHRFYRRADAYVSLHRGEGFGLCMAEAMAAGLPVVATGWSGNLDFMSSDSAFLVNWDAVPLRQELAAVRWFHESMTWAEPRLDDAIDKLRTCAFSPGAREARAQRGQQVVLERLSPARIGELSYRLVREQ